MTQDQRKPNQRKPKKLLSTLMVGTMATLGLNACQSSSTPTVVDSQPQEKTLMTLTATPLPALAQVSPKAEKIPYTATYHGDLTLSDPWHWLRDPDYPNTDDKAVLDYLKAENSYFDHFKAEHQPFINTLFEEFKGRLDETETSVPWVSNGYQYRWEYQSGAEYRTWYRQPMQDGALIGSEEVLLNEPKLAAAHEYFVIGDWDVSPDNRYLAYALDTNGDERYDIFVQDLTTGKLLPFTIADANGSVAFAHDGQSLVYGLLEQGKWRTQSINAFNLITQKDRVLLAETDDSFFLGFGKTRDDQYFILGSGKGSVDDAYAMKTDLSGELLQLASRDLGYKFDVDHAHGKFYILTNDQHVNFRLAVVDDQNPSYDNWQTLIAGSDTHYLRDISLFKDFMALKQSVNGLEQLEIHDYQGNVYPIDFPEALYTANFGNNPEFDQQHFRLGYQSMITPSTVYDLDIQSRKLTERKQAKIPSGYDKAQYQTKRVMAKARDGAMIPVSLMYPKGMQLDGSNPVHLYAYGAYGSGMTPYFSSARLSLVDRGVVYAIAHIRGGDEMGYQWYLDGKLEKRTNTFNDFVDVARYLIDEQYTQAGNISISGRSAGGELMGAAVIQAPELWSSVILGVPFVDVLNTMLDASLPLTPPEWVEWGNPIEDKAAFEYIQSYSPYDNITAKAYPAMLVTGGLNDPRVTYWEPAKWTAKMRDLKTDNNLLMMRMNMGAGHFANSGRYGRLMDYAEEYAFTLLSHGIKQ